MMHLAPYPVESFNWLGCHTQAYIMKCVHLYNRTRFQYNVNWRKSMVHRGSNFAIGCYTIHRTCTHCSILFILQMKGDSTLTASLTLPPPLPLVQKTKIGKWLHHRRKYQTWFLVAPWSKEPFGCTPVESTKSEFLAIGWPKSVRNPWEKLYASLV